MWKNVNMIMRHKGADVNLVTHPIVPDLTGNSVHVIGIFLLSRTASVVFVSTDAAGTGKTTFANSVELLDDSGADLLVTVCSMTYGCDQCRMHGAKLYCAAVDIEQWKADAELLYTEWSSIIANA
jgi:hypothetical protein